MDEPYAHFPVEIPEAQLVRAGKRLFGWPGALIIGLSSFAGGMILALLVATLAMPDRVKDNERRAEEAEADASQLKRRLESAEARAAEAGDAERTLARANDIKREAEARARGAPLPCGKMEAIRVVLGGDPSVRFQEKPASPAGRRLWEGKTPLANMILVEVWDDQVTGVDVLFDPLDSRGSSEVARVIGKLYAAAFEEDLLDGYRAGVWATEITSKLEERISVVRSSKSGRAKLELHYMHAASRDGITSLAVAHFEGCR